MHRAGAARVSMADASRSPGAAPRAQVVAGGRAHGLAQQALVRPPPQQEGNLAVVRSREVELFRVAVAEQHGDVVRARREQRRREAAEKLQHRLHRRQAVSYNPTAGTSKETGWAEGEATRA